MTMLLGKAAASLLVLLYLQLLHNINIAIQIEQICKKVLIRFIYLKSIVKAKKSTSFDYPRLFSYFYILIL